MAPGEQMQGKADPPEKFAALEQQAKLWRTQKAALDQVVEGFAAEFTACDPGDRVDVAQATGTALDVGFQIVRRCRRSDDGGPAVRGACLRKSRGMARCFPVRSPPACSCSRSSGPSSRRTSISVVMTVRSCACILPALLGISDAVADFDAGIPEQGEEVRTGCRGGGGGFWAASGPAGRHPSRGAVRRGHNRRRPPARNRHGLRPGSRRQASQMTRSTSLARSVTSRAGGLSGQKTLLESRIAAVPGHGGVAPARCPGHSPGSQGRADTVVQSMATLSAVRMLAARCRAVVGQDEGWLAGWFIAFRPAPRVRTSQPLSVISTVCSHWADSE